MSSSKQVVVTGGAGFIGSHLTEALLKQGHHVTVLDNLSSGKRENLAACAHQIQFVEADIRDRDAVQACTHGADAIFHLAAMASVFESMQNPALAHDINVSGTLNVFEAARVNSVRKVLFASTAAIYGSSPVLPKTESLPAEPVSPYGLGKWMGEQYAQLYSDLYGIQFTCFRFFNVFGPRQNPKSQYSGVISIFLDTVLAGANPTVYGDGQQTRDFVHVSDIVQANVLAFEKQPERFARYNVACGQGRSLLEILDWLKTYTKKPFDIEYKVDRRGDLRHSIADISHIQTDLGFQPRMSFFDGLAQMIDEARHAIT